jgi:hypothetical protein
MVLVDKTEPDGTDIIDTVQQEGNHGALSPVPVIVRSIVAAGG